MKRLERILYTIGLTIPVYIVCFFAKKPQVILSYTGGFMGVMIMLVIPAYLLYAANGGKVEREVRDWNIHKSWFHRSYWQYILWVFTVIAMVMTIYGEIVGD